MAKDNDQMVEDTEMSTDNEIAKEIWKKEREMMFHYMKQPATSFEIRMVIHELEELKKLIKNLVNQDDNSQNK